MLKEYKGVDLSINEEIRNYISTYHILDRDNYLDYLDNDMPLQKLVEKHHNKKRWQFLLCIAVYSIIIYLK